METTLIFAALAASLTAQSFEVASIKRSAWEGVGMPPGGMGCSGGPGSRDPVRFSCKNYSLLRLVMQAYDLDYSRVTSLPWMQDEVWFDLAAKVPEGATLEQFRQMLQGLLADRFKLVAHFKSKEMPIYELAVAKGGPTMTLKGENRPQVPLPAGVHFTSHMEYPGTTMADFARKLSNLAGRTVRDERGLRASTR